MSKFAIIGISGLFPGSSTSEGFWNNLMEGKDLLGIANEEDFGADPNLFFHPNKGVVDKCYSTRGGYIRDFQFDPNGYQTPSDQLKDLDKLYQWSLYVAKEALRESGYLNQQEALKKCGVILGNLSFPTGQSHKMMSEVYTQTTQAALRDLLGDETLQIPTTNHDFPNHGTLDVAPSKIVHEALGLGTTHYSLDAACATSLYAIKLACDELITGKSDMMLAGAVCGSDQLFIHMGFSIFHAYADSNSKFVPLDDESGGLVSSEGAGMVVIKRLADAERDGDNILAVICGTGLSNDGRGKFLLSPNPEGQKLAFERAYQQNGISPENTSYLECHATGTPLGDVTELNSIADFFKKYNAKPLLGSVKSNMGHLLTAAAMSGLHKVVLSMQKEVIPPNINLHQGLNADNNWIGEKEMITQPTPWKDEVKQAAINSFGFGGTNAHMVVQNYVKSEADDRFTKPQRFSKTNGEHADNQRVTLKPMAIIGMEAHFGDCTNLADFYATIYHGKQHFREMPRERWKGIDQNAELLKSFGFEDGLPPKGAYIEDFEIDLLRYKIQPAEAETLEPQQALILKVADQAIMDANLKEGQNVAVLIAMESEPTIHHYLARWDLTWQMAGVDFGSAQSTGAANRSLSEADGNNQRNKISDVDFGSAQSTGATPRSSSGAENETKTTDLQSDLLELTKNAIYHREGTQTPSQHTSFVGNIMASRIAALWDFSGPAFTVSAGEQSAFKALEIAQNLLSAGEVDAVVVGAVDFSGGLEQVLFKNRKQRVNSNSKPSLSFNKNDEGWLIGEGAGAVVLTAAQPQVGGGSPLEVRGEAEQKAYAIIDKIGGNSSPEGIDYQEVMSSSTMATHEFIHEQEASAIGSVETNIGHTGAATGMASLIKTALCLNHNFIPAIPNWEAPKAAFSNDGNYFPENSRPWVLKENQAQRKAKVIGSEGQQVVLSEAHSTKVENEFLLKNMPSLFPLSGNDVGELHQQLNELENELETTNSISELASKTYQKFKTKNLFPERSNEPFPERSRRVQSKELRDSVAPLDTSADSAHRSARGAVFRGCVLVAKTAKELSREIQFFKLKLADSIKTGTPIKTPRGSYFTPNPLGQKGKLALMYPGSATAYKGLGKELFQLFPQLKADFSDIEKEFHKFIAPQYLYPKKKSTNEADPDLYQDSVAMMSSGVFFSKMWTHILRKYFGLKPDLAAGYSMGECSSMFYANQVWGTEHTHVFQNSPIFKKRFAGDLDLLAETWEISSKEAKEKWVGLVLLAPRTEVEKLIQNQSHVFLTFVNTDSEVVISGDKTECYKIAQTLDCQTIEIPFQNIIHHEFCRKEWAGLIEMHGFPLKQKPDFDYFSSLSGNVLRYDSQAIATNSAEVCCQTVDFPKTVRALHERGVKLFVEVGAGSTCTGWTNSILEGNDFHAVAADQKGKTDARSLVELLAQLTSHGVALDLSILFPERENAAKKRSFNKKIRPGGKRIYDTILTEENRVKFAPLKRKEPVLDVLPPNPTEVNSARSLKGELALVEMPASIIETSESSQRAYPPSEGETGGGLSSNGYSTPALKGTPSKGGHALGGLAEVAVGEGIPPPVSPSKGGHLTGGLAVVAVEKANGNGQNSIQKEKQKMIHTKEPTSTNQAADSTQGSSAAAEVRGSTPQLAENGLPILNFQSGEHLIGKDIVFTQDDLREFAYGSIAKVFGEEYAIIDTYRRRTMLPMDPYLLVSRVTGLKGERGKFEPSTMQTEYDIPHGAWFTTDRQIPWAVSVESGQCDLLLISYLGIDFQAKGDLVYRLLDCTLTFVDDLPFEGQTLRYDISINSFVRNGDNLLFFFSYRCYVHDRLVLKMDGGCAGYFKDDELEAGSGVVYKDSEIEARKNATKRSFVPLLKTTKTSFSKDELRHLINGEPEKCFGDISYYANGRNPSLCLPPEKILMLDRIVSVDLKGGAYGLGYIVAEKDLSPEDWFFPCHFRDDEVLAGSLQAEGGGNLLRFFMLMLGLQRLTKDARYQPIFDLPQKVRCRKQVVPGKDTKLIYKLEIKEIGLTPNPYVIGDLEIISNDIITVHFENLGLQLREKDNPRYLELANETTKPHSSKTRPELASGAVLLDEKAIEEFALGDMSKAFGDDFKIYEGRTSSRQPNTDLQVITRVLSIDGARGDFSKPTTCVAEYDVPENVWYYDQNSTHTMPYSVLMEIALQPCGLMGAYLGSTLQFPDKDLYFRNLDGDGEMFDLPKTCPELTSGGTDFRGKTITNKAVLKSSIALGGTVLQNYTFECSIDGHLFYKGKSSFGFFPADALASQVGLDKGAEVPSWLQSQNLQPKDYMQIKLDSLYGKMKLYKAPAGKPHYRLAEDQLNLVDTLRVVKNGGEHGKGYVHATRFMQPYDWFFTCHFYTDPVMPGSLGVEAMLQAMQVFALQQDLGTEFNSPKFVQLPNHKTNWKYRGQIFQHVKNMHLEVHIKSISRKGGILEIIGDAYLWNEGMRIYQVTDLGLGIEEA